MALMLSLVLKTTFVKDDLVTPDYYAKELSYQVQIDKQNRTLKLKEQPIWDVYDGKVRIRFPRELATDPVKADILFYNPAEAGKDFKVYCIADSTGYCEVSSRKFQHGVYQMKMDWVVGGSNYYNEGTIRFQ